MLQLIQTPDAVEKHFREYVLNIHSYTPVCFIDDRAKDKFYVGFHVRSASDAGLEKQVLLTHDALKHLVDMLSAENAGQAIAERSATSKDWLNPLSLSMAENAVTKTLPAFRLVLESMDKLESEPVRSVLLNASDYTRMTGEYIFRLYAREVNPEIDMSAIRIIQRTPSANPRPRP